MLKYKLVYQSFSTYNHPHVIGIIRIFLVRKLRSKITQLAKGRCERLTGTLRPQPRQYQRSLVVPARVEDVSQAP